jgi:surface protein
MRNCLLQIKSFLFITSFLVIATVANAQDRPFITVWQTDNPGTSEDNQITIPGTGTDYLIEWEEVGNEASNSGSETGTDEHTVTFPSAGTYRVMISGAFHRIEFYKFEETTDAAKLIEIEQWGDIEWATFSKAFFGCKNLEYSAIDAPVLTNVTDIGGMFRGASMFNGDLSTWDVSNIEFMDDLFYGAVLYNQDISSWDVSNVKSMSGMFHLARSFNQDIGLWDVSSVTSMRDMFFRAESFNQYLGNWNVSNVENMSGMFWGADSFNQYIQIWDVSKVRDMSEMFFSASNFDQQLGAWELSNIENMMDIFRSSNISNINYDNTLLGWANNDFIPENIDLGEVSVNLTFCEAIDARSKLVNDFGWSITGDRYCLNQYFVTRWKTDLAGVSNSNQITIPGVGTDYLIEWEQIGNLSNNGSEIGNDDHTLTFPNPGDYRVKISGDFKSIRFANSGDKNKIISIESWGNLNWQSLESAFYGCQNLEVTAVNKPNLNSVTNLNFAFRDTPIKGKSLSLWSTGEVSTMEGIFAGATQFNANLENWDVSSVATFTNMFNGATNFNRNLAAWNLVSATNMEGMLDNSGLSIIKYVLMLNEWSQNAGLPSNITLGVEGLRYCYKKGRETLINNKNWDFTGDVKDCSNQFVSIWKTDNVGISNDNQIEIPGVYNGHDANYLIEWEEVGNEVENNGTGSAVQFGTITFPSIGTYRVKISGDFAGIAFNNSRDKNKIVEISKWGDIAWKSYKSAFYGCKNLQITATDEPNFSRVNSLYQMFRDVSLNGEIENWDVSNITDMGRMFYDAVSFNKDISKWDVSNVTNMSGMFAGATSFNIDISDWNVSKVAYMNAMFSGASSFNQNLNSWDVSNVSNMYAMFRDASSFNGSIGNWDVSNVTNIRNMFEDAISFNQDLNSWNLQNAHDLNSMFEGATAFNGEIGNWNVSNVINMSRMFADASSFDQNLNNWDVSNVTDMTSMFNSASSFNSEIGNWNVSNITDMGRMFYNAVSFNKDISEWNVSNVISMIAMFERANSFNQELNSWDVSNVTDMKRMFYRARSFNGDISNWNVSATNDFSSMFIGCGNFNRDISNWDVSSANSLAGMFAGATSFNQDLGSWDVSKVENFNSMFYGSGYNHPLSDWSIDSAKTMNRIFPTSYLRSNYQETLNAWAQQTNVPNDVEMSAEGMKYCITEGRDFLINNKGWSITNDEYFCGEPFTAVFNTESPGVSADNQLQLPTSGGPFILEWEDVNDPNMKGIDTTSNAVLLDLPYPGSFRVKITGDIERINFADKGDKLKLTALESWGDIYWLNLDSAFMGCSNMTYKATDYPNLDYINSLNYTFAGATEFDANMARWDIRTINDMHGMLDGTAVSEENYEETLFRWFDDYWTKSNITIGVEGLEFCIAPARDSLISSKNWTFIGDQETCGRPFITTWDTRNANNEADTTIILPIASPIYNELYRITWEEIGNSDNKGDSILSEGYPLLTFDSPGIYQIKISGKIDQIRYSNGAIEDKNKLISVDQWGDIQWTSLIKAFKDCDSLQYNATDIPNLDEITSLYGMFEDTYLFNGDISNWDVSTVKNFNQMFRNASSFNQNLNNWDVSSATQMNGMFEGAVKFNGNISDWNVSQVANFHDFCLGAEAFNRPLNNWNIASASDMFDMLSYTGLSKENYDLTLVGWAALETAPDSIMLGVQNLGFCNDSARNFLKESKAWSFIGDAYLCSEPFITIWKTDNPGDSEDNQIIFPGYHAGRYSIQWMEVDNPTNTGLINARGFEQITFPHPGIYELQVRGDLRGFKFYNNVNGNYDRNKLLAIKQWGEIQWESLEYAFYRCDSLTYSATDTPDLSLINSIAYMFYDADKFNANINNWDVSNISDFSYVFRSASSFNNDLGNWDVSNATSMISMLSGSGLSSKAYDQTLMAWAQLDSLQTNVELGASGLEYCFSKRARDYLINQKGWTISYDSENCESAFTSKWNSVNEGQSQSDQIIIPISGGESLIYWEDINDIDLYGLEISDGSYHTLNLPQSGEYRIKIIDGVNRIHFSDLGDKLKITEIQNWGDIQWTNFNGAFAGCENLSITATDAPDLSQVTDMSRMFYNAKSMNQDINHWNVSNVANMSDLFHGASAFNQDLSTWDVSNVTNMSRMFASATAFNQDLTDWNTANVKDMDFMFWDADSFQGDISSWDVSNVNNMWGMFYSADSVNSDISSWDVSSVTNMTEMFRETKAFNQDISRWNTANVTDISGMFYEAASFDQDLGDWDLSSVGSLFEFLTNSGLSVQNYDATLEGWATNANIPSDIALSAEGLIYCASAEYRQQLIDDFGWGIIGDVQCSLVLEETFPAAEATKVEKDTEIYLTFDQTFEEIDFGNIELSDVSGNAVTIHNVVADSLTLRIIHNGLGFNTYEVTIPENTLMSASGKVNDEIKWSFATQSILAAKDKQLATNLANYPNPFSDYTTLRFSLTEGNSFDLLVYDMKGQLVRQECYNNRASGEQSIKFERKGLPTGLYHYQIQATQGAVSGKMMIK